MSRTARIIAETLHEDIVRNYEWSEEVRPHFLWNKLALGSNPERRAWFKGMGLRQVTMPEVGDPIPEGLPDWVKEHIRMYLEAPELPQYPEYVINYVPTLEEVYQIILRWGGFWGWIPELDMSFEELEDLAAQADWICIPFWKDALSENVNKIVRREAIKPHKNF